jgi:hypothetical protein
MTQFIYNNKAAFTIYKGLKAIEMYYKAFKMHGLKVTLSIIKNK